MSYIKRGNMTAEVLEREYTRIGNRLLRDPRISLKAKGLFSLIASHSDGFGISPERIAKQCTDGIGAIRTGLNELEQFDYLTRTQERGEDGRLTGEVVYRITDMPWWEPEVENCKPAATSDDAESGDGAESGHGRDQTDDGNASTSSDAAACGQSRRSEPVVGYPQAADPQAANRTPKKTTVEKTTSVEDDGRAPSARSAADGRRPPTGSSAREAGGSAASGKSQPRLTTDQKRTVQAVRDALPRHLDRELPVKTPRVLADAILDALAGRTVQQLVEFRVLRRWDGYWASKFAAGEVGKPIGAVLAMLKHQQECGSPRCEDRVDVDTGSACRSCEVRLEDKRAARKVQQPEAQEVPAPRTNEGRRKPQTTMCASCHSDRVPALKWDGKPYCKPCLARCRCCGVEQPDQNFLYDHDSCPSCAPQAQHATA